MPVPGMALAELLRRVDPFPLERRRHADVGHEHLGRGGVGPGDQLVVVAGGPDDLEVGLDREQRPHALAHDHVVVGEEDRDATGLRGSNPSYFIQSHEWPVRQVAGVPRPGVLVSRPPDRRGGGSQLAAATVGGTIAKYVTWVPIFGP